MKIPFLLLLSVVWSCAIQPKIGHKPEQEEITIYLGPKWGSKVLQVGNPAQEENPSDVPDRVKQITTNKPVTERNLAVDLSPRLFSANYEDSVFDRKTLNLSGLKLTGEDVKNVLHHLNETLLSRVVCLDLTDNGVWDLPMYTFPVQLEYNLQELRLSHNRLLLDDAISTRDTRFELSRLRRLKKLSLSHCGLTSLNDFEFPPLQSLDLSDNRLIELPSSLVTLSTLQELDVSGNRLRYLGSSPLASLTGLRMLNLSSNGLERMWDDPLEKMYSLETVYLDNNKLSEPPKVYQFTGSYQPKLEVYMSGNPFTCDCAFTNTMNNVRLQVNDKLNVTCMDTNNVEWSSDAKPASQCSPHWETVKQKWSGTKEWFRDNRPGWDTLYRSIGWLLFGVTLGLIYAHRRAKKTPSPSSQVPYNILDDDAAIA